MTDKEAKALQPGQVFESLFHAESFRVIRVEKGAKSKPAMIVAERVNMPLRTFKPDDLRYYRVKP